MQAGCSELAYAAKKRRARRERFVVGTAANVADVTQAPALFRHRKTR